MTMDGGKRKRENEGGEKIIFESVEVRNRVGRMGDKKWRKIKREKWRVEKEGNKNRGCRCWWTRKREWEKEGEERDKEIKKEEREKKKYDNDSEGKWKERKEWEKKKMMKTDKEEIEEWQVKSVKGGGC